MERKEKMLMGMALLAIAPEAFAYLDPGTGSMIIQGLIAAIAMAGVTARLYWHRLLVFFGMRQEATTEDTEESSHPPQDRDG